MEVSPADVVISYYSIISILGQAFPFYRLEMSLLVKKKKNDFHKMRGILNAGWDLH